MHKIARILSMLPSYRRLSLTHARTPNDAHSVKEIAKFDFTKVTGAQRKTETEKIAIFVRMFRRLCRSAVTTGGRRGWRDASVFWQFNGLAMHPGCSECTLHTAWQIFYDGRLIVQRPTRAIPKKMLCKTRSGCSLRENVENEFIFRKDGIFLSYSKSV